MTAAYFDCFAGISGDMILGALIDLGFAPDVLEQELRKLPLDGYRIKVTRVNKLGVMATKVDVVLVEGDAERLADSQYQEVQHQEPAHRDHGHSDCHQSAHHHHGRGHGHSAHHHHVHHDHDHNDDHNHNHKQEQHQHHVHRSLADILRLIERSDLAPAVKDTASQVFRRLGESEARVHGVPVELVHFHEVGATDAIVDVVGCAIGLHLLGIDEVYASPVHLGQGMVKMAHGLYPIPGPATANLLAGVPVYQTDIRGELTTPTGAAILTAVARGYGPMRPMRIKQVGYGAGTKDRSIPNVLRIVLGEATPDDRYHAHGLNLGTNPMQHSTPTTPSGYHEGRAVMIESNIDDMNPQFYDYLFERLTEAGAMDMYLSQVQMKKNRPAAVLHVLTAPHRVDEALAVIFAETTTIGVRTYEVTKRMLQREMHTVETAFGPIRVKIARLGSQVVNVKPEYDDCKAAARATGVPLKQVDEQARAAAAPL